uniref:Uncharacterized protein n=1 Tax=Rhizophora mucronata TaxID=61149 RepID=A0A2P2PXU0_RHIMU
MFRLTPIPQSQFRTHVLHRAEITATSPIWTALSCGFTALFFSFFVFFYTNNLFMLE